MEITEDAIVEQSMNTMLTAVGTTFIVKAHHAPKSMDVGPVGATLLGATFIAIGFTFSAVIASVGDNL